MGRGLRRAGAGLGWVLLAWVGSALADDAPLRSEHEKTLYALGFKLGVELTGFSLSDEELAVVGRGLGDAARRRPPRVNERAYPSRLDALLVERRTVALAAERVRSEAFLAGARSWPGVEVLPGGTLFVSLREGQGRGAKPGSVARLHFHGRLADGTIFDSSVERGEPAKLAWGRMPACWRTALGRMRVGGKARIACPADEGFGDAGTPRVPGGAALDVEIELLDLLR